MTSPLPTAATTGNASECRSSGRFKTLLVGAALLGGIVLLAGCESANKQEELAAFPTAAATTAEPAATGGNFTGLANSMEGLDNRRPLTVGDTVSFQIVEEKEPPITLPVASSGEIEVPLIGRVPAAGRTPQAVAYTIKTELERSLYKKATVIVALESETTKPEGTFYVTGQVQSQGPQEIPRGEEITVAQAILRAGGFADFADKRRVTVIRKAPDGTVARVVVDVKDILEKGRLEKDVALQPGDYVLVRERMFNF